MPSSDMINRENELVCLRIGHHHNSDEVSDKKTKDILKNPEDSPQQQPSKFHGKWDEIFLILCETALFIDPLYCYIPYINETYGTWTSKGMSMCYFLDFKLFIVFCVLRSASDLFYVLDVFIFSRRILRRRNGMTFWASCSGVENKKTVSDWKGHKPAIMSVIYKFLQISLRIFIALPIPQAILLLVGAYDTDLLFTLLIFYLVQYALRAYGTYELMKQNPPNIETEIGRWRKAILDFIPFVIAAHLFGAVWYYFALRKEIDCWRSSCEDERFCVDLSDNSSFGCFANFTVTGDIKEKCTQGTDFNFGVYANAVETRITSLTFHPRKILHCFWWGLRNLSSFGSDLKTSSDMTESTLSVLVSITGMALFLVYLNARVQGSKKKKEQLNLSRKMRVINLEIDLWLSRRGLPKDMNKVIRERVRQELQDHRDVDVKNFLAILLLQQGDILYQLRLASLKKMPIFDEIDERVLKSICKQLEPVTYPKNSYIIHAGEQFWNVLFITQGTVLTYTNTNVGAITISSSGAQYLNKGDFYGEELVTWALSFGSFPDLPVSSRTVMSKTKVEAFAITAIELECIVSTFKIYFSRKLPHLERFQLENLAASYIQAAWRRHYAIKRPRRSTGWDIALQRLVHIE